MSTEGRIVVETIRGEIRSVARRWHSQYPNPDERKAAIGTALDGLDLDTATAEDVEAIIGNGSWTTMCCDVCSEDVTGLVRLGDEPDYESATLYACRPCLVRALDALSAALAGEAIGADREKVS